MNGTTPLFSLFVRLGGRAQLLYLLRHFYADVRQHREIGPIFAVHIPDWTAHLEKIANFWSGATGGPALYNGAMPFKHVGLALEERHFAAWLDLWQRYCRAHLPPAEAQQLIAVMSGANCGMAQSKRRRCERVIS